MGGTALDMAASHARNFVAGPVWQRPLKNSGDLVIVRMVSPGQGDPNVIKCGFLWLEKGFLTSCSPKVKKVKSLKDCTRIVYFANVSYWQIKWSRVFVFTFCLCFLLVLAFSCSAFHILLRLQFIWNSKIIKGKIMNLKNCFMTCLQSAFLKVQRTLRKEGIKKSKEDGEEEKKLKPQRILMVCFL